LPILKNNYLLMTNVGEAEIWKLKWPSQLPRLICLLRTG
jgi:hypothetical protein